MNFRRLMGLSPRPGITGKYSRSRPRIAAKAGRSSPVGVNRVGRAISACRLHPRLRTYGCDAAKRRFGPIATWRGAAREALAGQTCGSKPREDQFLVRGEFEGQHLAGELDIEARIDGAHPFHGATARVVVPCGYLSSCADK
jgi:hypothetical protein